MMLCLARASARLGRDKRGFTLVELLAVMAVLAIIAAIAVPRFTGTMKEAKARADKSSALVIARAAEQKWLDDGESERQEYTKDALVPDYVRKIEWQDHNGGNFTAIVDVEGKCIAVYYGKQKDGTNLLTGKPGEIE